MGHLSLSSSRSFEGITWPHALLLGLPECLCPAGTGGFGDGWPGCEGVCASMCSVRSSLKCPDHLAVFLVACSAGLAEWPCSFLVAFLEPPGPGWVSLVVFFLLSDIVCFGFQRSFGCFCSPCALNSFDLGHGVGHFLPLGLS